MSHILCTIWLVVSLISGKVFKVSKGKRGTLFHKYILCIKTFSWLLCSYDNLTGHNLLESHFLFLWILQTHPRHLRACKHSSSGWLSWCQCLDVVPGDQQMFPLEVWEREQEMTQCQSFSSAFPGTQNTPWAPDSLFFCLRECPCYPSSIFLGSIYGSFQCEVINYPYLCKNPTEDECPLSGYCLVYSAQTLVPPKKQSILLTLVSCLRSQHEINAQQAALKLTYRWPWRSSEFILIEIQSIEVFSCGWQWLTGPGVSTYLSQACWPAG